MDCIIVYKYTVYLTYDLKGGEVVRQLSQDGLRKVSTRDYAYAEIKQQIITGTLPPEEPIVEEQLSTQLDISRTPLREALQRLEIEELVIRQLNGRLKVAPISVQEVNEIFTVRRKLEELVVAQATERATERDLRKLTNITEMIEKNFREDNLEEILYYGGQFHSFIYDLSGNQTAVNILSQLNDHIHRYRRIIPTQAIGKLEKSLDEHRRILQCMMTKDVKGAVQAISEHIESSLQDAIASIDGKMFENKVKE